MDDDLWKAMSNQSIDALDLPADIRTIMTSWSLQTGYPIVTVRRNYDLQTAIVTQVTSKFRTYKKKQTHILTFSFFAFEQERFYLLASRNSSDFPLWWIPLTYTTDFNTTFQAWILGTEDGIELELPSAPTDWVIFNVDQIG